MLKSVLDGIHPGNGKGKTKDHMEKECGGKVKRHGADLGRSRESGQGQDSLEVVSGCILQQERHG